MSKARSCFFAIVRKEKAAPGNAKDHQAALDILSRDIRRYTAAMFKPDMPYAEADLLASLIEEEDFTASLGETLFQVARRVDRQAFSPVGKPLVDATLDQIARVMRAITVVADGGALDEPPSEEERRQFLPSTRQRCLQLGAACRGKSAVRFWSCWAAPSVLFS